MLTTARPQRPLPKRDRMLLKIHPRNPEPRKVAQVVEALRNGGVVVIPTDTVYTFACSALHPKAIERISRLKGSKHDGSGSSLVCADLSQLSLYASQVNTPAFRLMKQVLPGPYTFILKASSEIPKLFKNKKRTVGIRVPDNAVAHAIVDMLGHALVVSSVHDPDEILAHSSDPESIHERLEKQVDMVVDGGICGLVGSTVVDLTGDEPVVLREGAGRVDMLR